MVRKKKTAKSSAGSREKSRRSTEKKPTTSTLSSSVEKVAPAALEPDLIIPVPKTLEKVSPTTPEIRIDTCESIDGDSLSQGFAQAVTRGAESEDQRPRELFRHDTLDEVVEVENDASPTLPPPEREALDVLEHAISEMDDDARGRDSLETDDSLEPLKMPNRSSALESCVSYEVLDTPCDPTAPAPLYPSLAAELIESDADGALQMGIEEMAYRDYLLSRSQPSESEPVLRMKSQDSIEADFFRAHQRDSKIPLEEEDEEEENVFEKAFSDACDMQLQAALTASLDEAAARRALLGEAPAEVDLTNVTALTESLTEATTVSTLSPSAPPMGGDVMEMMRPIAEAEATTPGLLVLPEGSVEKIERKALVSTDSLEQGSDATLEASAIDLAAVEASAPDLGIVEASAPCWESLEASAPIVEPLETSTPAVELDLEEVASEAVIVDKMQEVQIENRGPLSPSELLELCANPLLNQQTKILEEFFAEVSPALTAQHPLHELLIEYQRSRTKLLALEEHLFQLKRDMEAQLPGLWSSSMQSTNVEGVCRDNHKVSQQLTYERVAFNSDHLPNVARALSTVRIFAQEQLSHAAFVCAKNRLKVNVYLHKLYTEECPLLQNIPAGASVTANDERDIDVVLKHQIRILRSCINVLFAFQRRPVSDVVFQVRQRF